MDVLPRDTSERAQCCHSGFQEFPRSGSKNSQVDVKIPKLINLMKNKVIQQALNNNFVCTVNKNGVDYILLHTVKSDSLLGHNNADMTAWHVSDDFTETA